LESVQDEEDLENPTVDKIRRVMHLVYSTAQANDLIPRSVEANPVTHVHIATTTRVRSRSRDATASLEYHLSHASIR
jgi:hypothetical protein